MIDQGVLAWAGPSLTQVDNRCPRTREGHPGIITGRVYPVASRSRPRKTELPIPWPHRNGRAVARSAYA